MRANKIQVNPRIYVKDFIGDPDKMAGGYFSGWNNCILQEKDITEEQINPGISWYYQRR